MRRSCPESWPRSLSERPLADVGAETWRSSRETIAAFGCAPTMRSTSLPPLNTSSVGMLRTPKRADVAGLSSTFIFATLTRPAISAAI